MVKIEDREAYLKTLRTNVLAETDKISKIKRFALFS